VYTNGLSQNEVHSRLEALANTIDSRGWAIKHINAVGYVPQQSDSDRLVNIPVVPPAETDATTPSDDIMDAEHNPIAQQFDQMISQSSQERRERLLEEMRKPATAAAPPVQQQSQWFMNSNPITNTNAAVAPVISAPQAQAAPARAAGSPAQADDEASYELLTKKLRFGENEAYGNLRTLQPSPAQPAVLPATDDAATATQAAQDTSVTDAPGPMTAGGDPAILSLSKNNDLNVATIARQAEKARGGASQDEVVISLH
jgi:hypothetical protein